MRHPAAIVAGLALNVPPCDARGLPFDASNTDMMSRRPPTAPTGSPPPMILPKVVRSGVTPTIVCAPR